MCVCVLNLFSIILIISIHFYVVLHNKYFGSRAVISESSKTGFKDSGKGTFLERKVLLF